MISSLLASEFQTIYGIVSKILETEIVAVAKAMFLVSRCVLEMISA